MLMINSKYNIREAFNLMIICKTSYQHNVISEILSCKFQRQICLILYLKYSFEACNLSYEQAVHTNLTTPPCHKFIIY